MRKCVIFILFPSHKTNITNEKSAYRMSIANRGEAISCLDCISDKKWYVLKKKRETQRDYGSFCRQKKARSVPICMHPVELSWS